MISETRCFWESIILETNFRFSKTIEMAAPLDRCLEKRFGVQEWGRPWAGISPKHEKRCFQNPYTALAGQKLTGATDLNRDF